jgi:hypothetical protein
MDYHKNTSHRGNTTTWIIVGVFVVCLMAMGVYTVITADGFGNGSVSPEAVVAANQNIETFEYEMAIDASFVGQDGTSNPINYVVGESSPSMSLGNRSSQDMNPGTSTYRAQVAVSGSARPTLSSSSSSDYWSGSAANAPAGFLEFEALAAKSTSSLQDVLAIESRTMDGVYYVNIREFPNIPLISSFTQPFLRRWVKIDPDELENGTATPSFLNNLELTSNTSKLQEAFIDNQEAIVKRAKQANIFTLRNTATKQVDGTAVTEYIFDIEKSALSQFFVDIIEIVEKDLPNTARREVPDKEAVREDLSGVAFSSVRVGVLDEKKYLQSLTVDMTVDTTSSSATTDSQTGSSDSATNVVVSGPIDVTVSMTLSDHNEPIDVTAPKDSESIQDIIQELQDGGSGMIQQSMSEARSSAKDARRQTDLSQIKTANALYKNDNGAYATNLDKLTPDYIRSVPEDPNDSGQYYYNASGDGTGYCIVACMKNEVPSRSKDACIAANQEAVSFAVETPESCQNPYGVGNLQ